MPVLSNIMRYINPMEKSQLTYIKNILLPCVYYSGITGIITAVLIFLFKLSASRVGQLSSEIYAYVRERSSFLPVIIVGAALLGLIMTLIIRCSPGCKGGGIPTSILLLRGLISFTWFKSIFLLFPSALLTYLCGIPLGTEGPAVQMGTAVGKGTVRIFARKHPTWERFIMTGGASAGFAAATGAPLTAIFFTFEEAHRRFSPTLFITSAVSAVTSTAFMQLLCPLAEISPSLFHFSVETTAMPLIYTFTAVLTGLLCGFIGAAFTKIYDLVHRFIDNRLRKLPVPAKIVAVFVSTAIIGYFSQGFLGTGEGIIESIFEGHAAWKLLVIYFCVRAIITITANNVGITGGLFVPMLCFGAIIGELCSRLMITVGILPVEYRSITVIIGICAFLAATSRTPIMATVFSIEAFGCTENLIPVMAGITVAYITIELLGIHDFTDIVMEGKLRRLHKDKTDKVIDRSFTVAEDAFAVGKQVRDILWPPECTVLSVKKKPSTHHHSHTGISAGDILELHYHTYDDPETVKSIEAILGKQ